MVHVLPIEGLEGRENMTMTPHREAGGCKSEFQSLHCIKTVKVTVDLFLLLADDLLRHSQILTAHTKSEGTRRSSPCDPFLTRKQSCLTCYASPQHKSGDLSEARIMPPATRTISTFSCVHRTPSHALGEGRQWVDPG